MFLILLYVGKVFSDRRCKRALIVAGTVLRLFGNRYSMIGRIEFGLLARPLEYRILPVLADALSYKLRALIPADVIRALLMAFLLPIDEYHVWAYAPVGGHHCRTIAWPFG